ncbi:hypothetical protein K492DRAFT_211870 [Lichtheimia hyalospora FSU 10163]|nr:hypothetical protein K492DRAFT_211870 [Lichtheimia hyalospora FSU 10163]
MTEPDAVPSELYYLGEYSYPEFPPRSLKTYQLKTILASHNVAVPSRSKKADLIKLFQDHVEPRRDSIIAEYKQQQQEKQRQQKEDQDNLGRGRRQWTPSRRVKEAMEMEESKKKQVVPRDDEEKDPRQPLRDKDGFVIPEVPAHKRNKPTSKEPSFTAQDSFASSDEDLDKDRKMTRDKVKRKRPVTVQQQPVVPTRRSTRGTFTAQDSFASSDEDVDLSDKVKQLHQRRAIKTTQRRPAPPATPTKSKDKKDENSQEESEDEEYKADSSDNEEEELESMDQTNLADEVRWLVEDNIIHEACILGKPRSEWYKLFGYLFRVYLGLVCLALLGTAVVVSTRAFNGYCDSEHDGASPMSCIPCPDHGVCFRGQLECPPLYHVHRPWYNAYGVLPVADKCLRDSAMGREIDAAEKEIKRILARAQGKEVCNQVRMGGHLNDVAVARLTGTEIRDILSRSADDEEKDMDTFQLIVSNALKQALHDPTIKYAEINGIPYYSTTKEDMPLWCSASVLLLRIPTRTKYTCTGVLVGLWMMIYAVYKYRQYYQMRQRTKTKLEQILNALQDQLKRHKDHPETYDRGIPVSQLRIQTSQGRVNQGNEVNEWLRVVHQVNKHPQVRRGHREVAGELCEIWELAL